MLEKQLKITAKTTCLSCMKFRVKKNEAVNKTEQKQRRKTISNELQSFDDKTACVKVRILENKTVVKCKWVFKR